MLRRHQVRLPVSHRTPAQPPKKPHLRPKILALPKYRGNPDRTRFLDVLGFWDHDPVLRLCIKNLVYEISYLLGSVVHNCTSNTTLTICFPPLCHSHLCSAPYHPLPSAALLPSLLPARCCSAAAVLFCCCSVLLLFCCCAAAVLSIVEHGC